MHLGRMADAYGSEKRLASWLHVERAEILERRLLRIDAARGALERALESSIRASGPCATCWSATWRHTRTGGELATLLDEEARIESSVARAARLELDAAGILRGAPGNRARACELLERAAARAPTAPGVDRRVLDELVRLHELDGRWGEAAKARRARIRFVMDPAAIAYELRALAGMAEKEGDLEAAVADVQRALAVDATDPTLVEILDRLLAATGKHDQRVATWLQEAARTEDGPRRSKALARAAKICDDLGRPPDAVRHLRSAWIASPGDPEVLDSLARLLAPVLSEAVDAGARSLVELYAQASEQSRDVGRKVTYLERVALLWEELLGDPSRAARAYEQVLELEKDRRTALVGRPMCLPARGRAHARACAARRGPASPGRRHEALAPHRARRALCRRPIRRARCSSCARCSTRIPRTAGARALETRLEEDAGRWELAAKSLLARIDIAGSKAEKVSLWLALAQLQHARLHKPLDAMQSLEQARALDPGAPGPARGDRARPGGPRRRPRRSATADRAPGHHATTPEDRARHLTRAAEIDELRLGDDVSALRTYQRALDEAPDDDLVAERLARLVARRGQSARRRRARGAAALLAKRIERAASPGAAQALSFDLAACW